MKVSRFIATVTVGISVLAAVGCSSPRTQYAAAPSYPIVVQSDPPPAPVEMAQVMPAQMMSAPLPASTMSMSNDAPVMVASNSTSYMAPAVITERSPRADRN